MTQLRDLSFSDRSSARFPACFLALSQLTYLSIRMCARSANCCREVLCIAEWRCLEELNVDILYADNVQETLCLDPRLYLLELSQQVRARGIELSPTFIECISGYEYEEDEIKGEYMGELMQDRD